MFRETWRLTSQKLRPKHTAEELAKAHDRAMVAEEVRTFFSENNVGKFIFEKMRRDRLVTLNKLAKVSPHDTNEIYKLQNQLLAIELVDKYVAEARVEFTKAKAQLEEAARKQ